MSARSQSLRFGRERRLTRPSEFLRVRNEGSVTRGSLLTLGAVADGTETPFRAGFITSRRVGGAVVRNRVRRRLREIVRRHQHAIRAGVWIVTIARSGAAKADSAALEREWLRLARKANVVAVSG